MEVWVILLLLWVAWKVFGSIFEEMQARKRKQQTDVGETISRPPPRRVPPVTRPAERTVTSTPPSASESSPIDKEERDIERLLREAMARKHQPAESQKKARPRTGKVRYVEQQTVETIPPGFPPPREKKLPPIEEYHFEPPPPMEPYHRRPQPAPVEHRKAVHKRVVRRVEPLPARRAPHLPMPAAKLTASPRVRRRRRRGSSPLFLADGLNKCEVRKGIVLAEILGEPKAFRM